MRPVVTIHEHTPMKFRILEREGQFYPQYLNVEEGSVWRLFPNRPVFASLAEARTFLAAADRKEDAIKVRIHAYP